MLCTICFWLNNKEGLIQYMNDVSFFFNSDSSQRPSSHPNTMEWIHITSHLGTILPEPHHHHHQWYVILLKEQRAASILLLHYELLLVPE